MGKRKTDSDTEAETEERQCEDERDFNRTYARLLSLFGLNFNYYYLSGSMDCAVR